MLSSEKIAEFKKMYNEAEHEISRVSHILSKNPDYKERMTIPAINELRYAGSHFLSALNSTDPRKTEKKYDLASDHVLRAKYDVKEMGVSILIKNIHLYLSKYGYLVVDKTLEGFAHTMRTIQEIQRRLNSVDLRQDSDGALQIERDFSILKGIEDDFESAIPLLNSYKWSLLCRILGWIIMFVIAIGGFLYLILRLGN